MIQAPLEEYLDGIKAEAVAELEQELISSDRIETLQNRLYVLRALKDNVKKDISSGRIAEKKLREAESDGDV